MIHRQYFGYAAVALTAAISIWRGRIPERLGIAIVAAGWVITPLVEQRESWFRPQLGFMTVDVVVLAAFIAMAFRYDRYWTICASAFQAIAVMIHFAFLINPEALYRAYFVGSFAIGYLILGSIIGGVLIERGAPFRRGRHSMPNPP